MSSVVCGAAGMLATKSLTSSSGTILSCVMSLQLSSAIPILRKDAVLLLLACGHHSCLLKNLGLTNSKCLFCRESFCDAHSNCSLHVLARAAFAYFSKRAEPGCDRQHRRERQPS